MLSWAWAVAVAPKLVAIASPRTMCVARIASSLSCFHPPAPPLPDYDFTPEELRPLGISSFSDALHRAGNCFPAEDIARLIGEWPHPQFLLSDLPQAGEATPLRRPKEEDQGADDHEMKVVRGRG